MRVSFAALLAAILALPAAAAGEGPIRAGWPAYAIPPGEAMAKSAPEPSFAPGPREREPLMRLKPGASCGASGFEVCFDSTGRITVPGAKRFLPGLPGLKPERLTVRRNGVAFGYSF